LYLYGYIIPFLWIYIKPNVILFTQSAVPLTHTVCRPLDILFFSIMGCNIEYNSSYKHKGSDDVLVGYIDTHQIHAARQ
jgi:hypothetical protein